MPKEPSYFRPKEAATGTYRGEAWVIGPNQIFEGSDRLVKRHPELFVPIEPDRQRPAVEQMTAAPGEQRG
jgi:hypothetical protein